MALASLRARVPARSRIKLGRCADRLALMLALRAFRDDLSTSTGNRRESPQELLWARPNALIAASVSSKIWQILCSWVSSNSACRVSFMCAK